MFGSILFIVSCDVRVRLRLIALVGRGVCARVVALVMCFVSRLLLSLSRLGAVACGSQQAMRFHSFAGISLLKEA